MHTLRPYQEQAINNIFQEWQDNSSTLLVMSTGTGKTTVFSEVVKKIGGRALIIAHREELIWQAVKRIESYGMDATVEMADRSADFDLFAESPVVVSTIQTQATGRMGRFNPNEFDLLVIDEAHHATAESYRRVIDYYRQNKNLKVLGVTATPDRADEAALGQVFESVAFDYEILDAINDGYLVPVEQQLVTIEGLDFSQIKTTLGDLNGADLAAVMEKEEMLHGVVSASLDIIGERRTLVFAVTVKQAEMYAEIFNRHRPDMADWVCGKTPKDRRHEILRGFSQGTTQVLVNVGVLTEGYDNPAVEVIVQARPTKSRCLYSQMIGRSTRPLPGIVDAYLTTEERKAAIAESSKPSCIAEGELVLTDVGLVPIEHITTQMKVWDGVEFVPHCGTIFRGEQRVITYAGLTATLDHEVWIHDETNSTPTLEMRKTFGECAAQQIAIRVTGIGRQEVREADGCFRRDSSREVTTQHGFLDDGMRLWKTLVERLHEFDCWQGGMSYLRQAGAFPALALAEMRGGTAALLQSERSGLREVRRAWDSIWVSLFERYGLMGPRESWTSSGNATRQNQQRWQLRAGQSSIFNKSTELQQQAWAETDARGSCIQDCSPRGGFFGRFFEAFFSQWPNVERNPYANASRSIQRKARVFDILNAGPRHRFTAQGLLVSNCLVIDFVGNAGRHKLMTTADILGGKYSDEVVQRVLRRAKAKGKSLDMIEALKEEARRVHMEAEERRRREAANRAGIVGVAQFSAREIDPFDVLQLEPVRERGWDKGKVISPKMAGLLRKNKIDPTKITYAQARAIIGKLVGRIESNLCTLPQANLLGKFGYEAKGMSFESAKQLIDAIAQNGWRRPAEAA